MSPSEVINVYRVSQYGVQLVIIIGITGRAMRTNYTQLDQQGKI
jgi:hypothetical protein